MAMPCGLEPTEKVAGKAGFTGFVTVPKVVLDGLMSMTEMLLQPLLVTTAMGENGPLAS